MRNTVLTLGICTVMLAGSFVSTQPVGATGAQRVGTLAGNYGRKVVAPDMLRSKARPVAKTTHRSLSPALSGACSDGWTVTPSCNVGGSTQVFGSNAVSPNNVWAVGASGSFPTRRTFVQHWDGSSWSTVPSPNSGAGDNVLTSVSASNSNDAWAVGYTCGDPANCNTSYRALAMRWNGSSWSVVPTPNVGTFGTFFNSVAALSPNNVWAVGSYSTDTASLTLAMHWDGSAWSVVPTANSSPTDNALYAVSGSNPNNLWAVGYTSGANGTVVLTERWNGSSWSAVNATAPGANSSLTSVAAFGSSDVWAVGTTCVDDCASYPTLVMHWNGSSWSTVATPSGDSQYNFLNAVVATSSSEVWAAGSYLDSSFSGHNLMLHWNGSSW